MRHWLREIPDLCAELQARSAPEEVTWRSDVRYTPLSWHPPMAAGTYVLQVEQLRVAGVLPAAAVAVAGRGGRVSGSPEPRLPFDEDEADLLGPRRPLLAAGPDTAGHDSVWSVLSFWCVDLAEHRGVGERGRRPRGEPPVPWLAAWLLERIDKACDDYPLIADLFTALRRIYGALRGKLGIVDVPQYMKGVPCSRCSMLTLLHKDGSAYVECDQCPALLTFDEYEEYVKSVSVEAKLEKKLRAVEWRLFLRIRRELEAVGWRYARTKQAVHGSTEVWTVHTWSRGDEDVQVWCMRGRRPDVRFNLADETEGWIGSAWIAANGGGTRLHKLASAAGVLSVPKEQS